MYHDHDSEVTCGKCDEQGRVKRAHGGRNRGPHVFYGIIASGNAVIKGDAMCDMLINTNVLRALLKHSLDLGIEGAWGHSAFH